MASCDYKCCAICGMKLYYVGLGRDFEEEEDELCDDCGYQVIEVFQLKNDNIEKLDDEEFSSFFVYLENFIIKLKEGKSAK